MTYRLNSKPISEAQFKRCFNSSMQRYIQSRAKAAFDEGKKVAIFGTSLGCLVVKP